MKKKFSNSSTRWLTRQNKDFYSKQAKVEGYRSRAAYKIIDILAKYQLLSDTSNVLDLGAAPGSWSQVIQKRTTGKIFAIDLLPIKPITNVDILQIDATSEEFLKFASSISVDLILSDISHNTSGNKHVDHLRISSICEEVLLLTSKTLSARGNLVMKIFQGCTEKDILQQMNQLFIKTKYYKPKASRKESSEIYLLGIGKK